MDFVKNLNIFRRKVGQAANFSKKWKKDDGFKAIKVEFEVKKGYEFKETHKTYPSSCTAIYWRKLKY